MEKKIILVLFPKIINKFDFQSSNEEFFIDFANIKNSFSQKKSIKSFSQEELIAFANIDYSNEIREIIKERPEPKIVLINYPHTKDNFVSLSQLLAQADQKITNLILLNISNYDLISSLESEYLICPLCEKIYKKEEVVKGSKEFTCPIDNRHHFPIEKVNKFNEFAIRFYLENIKEVIEKFLKFSPHHTPNINQLTVNKKEEIFSGEIQNILLNIIRSI
jgi:hypothetical protein